MITFYHIPGVKVGSTTGNLRSRLRKQGYTMRDADVIQTIEDGLLTQEEIWEHEQDLAVTYGYAPEGESSRALVVSARTNNPMHNENNPKIAEHKKNLVERNKTKHPLRFKKSKKKLSKASKEIVQCPHCDKQGAALAMRRWHFNNCRDKEI